MGDVASMSRQVTLIRRMSPVSDEILDVFDLGKIVVFAGHLIDHPDRLSNRRLKVRFPPDPDLEEAVRQVIRQKLIKMNARIGYCSVACGADILFAEELLKLKRTTLHVVLPFALKDFYKTSVDFGLEDNEYLQKWRERCDKVIRAASEVHYATNDLFLGDEVLFDYGNSFSQARAQQTTTGRTGRGVTAVVELFTHRPPVIFVLQGASHDSESGYRNHPPSDQGTAAGPGQP